MNEKRGPTEAMAVSRYGPNVLNPPRHAPDEFTRLGREIYERDIKANLSEADRGKYVAIDIEGRGWELDESQSDAVNRLGDRLPDAQIWVKRVGFRAVGVIGGSRSALETDEL